MTVRVRMVAAGIAAALAMTIAIQPATAAVAQTFRLQLDARPPVGEPWSFLRFFPRTWMCLSSCLVVADPALVTDHRFFEISLAKP